MERGLQTLLDLAAQHSMPQPWPRVHAINTLRLCFLESSLAPEASAFCSRGMLLYCVMGVLHVRSCPGPCFRSWAPASVPAP